MIAITLSVSSLLAKLRLTMAHGIVIAAEGQLYIMAFVM